jgi:Tfp pilus assembly protein PilZ
MGEMRKFFRLDINVNVQWSKVEEKADQKNGDQGVVKNISEGGICLIVDKKIKIGDIVILDIELLASKTIHARGRVAWIKPLSLIGVESKDRFDAGVEFTEISDSDREEIKKFIVEFLNG